MSSEFSLNWRADGLHKDAINSVAISPDDTGAVLHRIVAKSAALSLAWARTPAMLISGTADGTLLTTTIDNSFITISGFKGHEKPIECLAVNNFMPTGTTRVSYALASAGYDLVNVWSLEDTEWEHRETIQPPPANAYSGDQEPIVTAVHWLHGDQQSGSNLFIAYLYHGIYCHSFEDGASKVIRCIHVPICAACTISPTGNAAAISNIVKGFDVYELPTGYPGAHVNFQEKPDSLAALPIKYVEGQEGTMLLHGDYHGKVRLVGSEEGDHFQTLYYEDCDIIQALDTFYDGRKDQFIIACGSSDPGRANGICAWVDTQVGGASPRAMSPYPRAVHSIAYGTTGSQ